MDSYNFKQVGCEGDGGLRVHCETTFCDVCRPKIKHVFHDERPWPKLHRAHRRIIAQLYPDLTNLEIQSALWTFDRGYGWMPKWGVIRDGRKYFIYAYGNFRGGTNPSE